MMIKFYSIFALIIFSVLSCRNIKTFPPSEHFDAGNETKEILGDKIFSVSGNVTHSNSYCGGARPSDQMLMEITSPKPTPNAAFFVKQGKYNNPGSEIFLTFKTDENGNFNFKLPPGDYVIIEQNRLDSTYYFQILKSYSKETDSYSAADTSCMNNWLKGSLIQLTIKEADVLNLNWDTHHGCWTDAPCIHYKGPYPP